MTGHGTRTTTTHHRRARPRRFAPALDRLEARIALSGTVTYDPATASLTVVGDATNNKISVSAVKPSRAATGSIVVVCDGQTTRFDQVPTLNSINVSSGAGDDTVGVYFRGFKPTSIRVDGGAGRDVLGLAGGGTIFDYLDGAPVSTLALTVTGDGAADASTSGDDVIGVSLDGLTLQNSPLSLDGGAGNDRVALSLTAVSVGTGVQASVLGGDGDDSTLVSLIDATALGGNVAVDGGGGRNSLAFNVAGLRVGAGGFNATVDGGASSGDNRYGVALTNLSLSAGAAVKVNVLGRAGNDQINYAQVGLTLAAGSTFTANVQGGPGNDTVNAVVLLPSGAGSATINLDGGPGTDALFLVAPRPRRGGPLTVNVVGFESRRGT